MSEHLVKSVSVARSNTVVIITAQCITEKAAAAMYRALAREASGDGSEIKLLVGDAAEAKKSEAEVAS